MEEYHQDRIKELYKTFNEVNDGTYELMSEITNSNDIITLRHHCADGYINDNIKMSYNSFRTKMKKGKVKCRRCSHLGNDKYKDDKTHIKMIYGTKKSNINFNYNNFDCTKFINRLRIKFKNKYELLDKYEGMEKEVRFRHNVCGTIFLDKPKNILKRTTGGCPNCGNSRMHTNINTMTEILTKLAEENHLTFIGYKSDNYNNKKKDKIILKCNKCKGTFEETIRNFENSHTCRLCSNKIAVGRKLSKEDKLLRIKENYPNYEIIDLNCLDTATVRDKITIRCNICGLVQDKTLKHLYAKAAGCKNHCTSKILLEYYNRETNKNPYNYTEEDKNHFMKRLIKKKGKFELLSEWNGMLNNATFKHTGGCGEVFTYLPKNLYNIKGTTCPKCPKSEVHLSHNELIDQINKIGKENNIVYKSLYNNEKYINKKQNVIFHCNNCGRDFKRVASKFLTVLNKCPSCVIKNKSKGEQELLEFIKSIYDNQIITNDKSLLGNKQEIDIYLPKLKLGFEYNGLYFHSIEVKGSRDYHKNKSKLAEKNDIKLFHINEYEWNNNQEYIKNLISIHILKNKPLYKDNLKVKEITLEEFNTYNKNLPININHSSIKSKFFGLFFNNILIMMAEIFDDIKKFKNVIYKYQIKFYYNYKFGQFENYLNKLLDYLKDKYKDIYIMTDYRLQEQLFFNKINNLKIIGLTKPYPKYHDGNNFILETKLIERKYYYTLYDCGRYVFTFK